LCAANGLRRTIKKPASAGFFIVRYLQVAADLFVVLALTGSTVTVEVEAVVGETDIEFFGDLALTLFDHFVGELDHLAAVEANQVVVVLLSGQLEYRLATFEVVTGNDTGIIKLVENAIDGSETNLFTQVDQSFIEIFGAGVLAVRLLQDFQDFDPGQGDLEPGLF
jgi:hypothetical protein